HDYPEKRVVLDVWCVLRYAGEPFGRENQELRWVDAPGLEHIGLLPADAPIVEALRTRLHGAPMRSGGAI
ncbi:MAG TPA: hypothetical protein VFY39_07645, partial [Gammaproteobacteria bacterium]|nr:hypothetical protein [Gammaproteobacteria bacterium]